MPIYCYCYLFWLLIAHDIGWLVGLSDGKLLVCTYTAPFTSSSKGKSCVADSMLTTYAATSLSQASSENEKSCVTCCGIVHAQVLALHVMCTMACSARPQRVNALTQITSHTEHTMVLLLLMRGEECCADCVRYSKICEIDWLKWNEEEKIGC